MITTARSLGETPSGWRWAWAPVSRCVRATSGPTTRGGGPAAREPGHQANPGREAALPFGRGRVFEAFGKQPVPAWAQELGIRTWAQFALKYIVSHPAVPVAIRGTAKMEYLTDNLAAARGPMPDAATRRRMAALVDAS
jgi:aryl-alcohol dehydrogenase-like predicted oxidoreductase